MKRKEDQTFEEYKILRKAEQETTKQLLKGTLFWDSSKKGTYIKPENAPT